MQKKNLFNFFCLIYLLNRFYKIKLMKILDKQYFEEHRHK